MCNQERRKVKRKGDYYSTHTSLIVAAPKKLLSVAMNGCCHGYQGLVTHAQSRFSQVHLFRSIVTMFAKSSHSSSWKYCNYSASHLLLEGHRRWGQSVHSQKPATGEPEDNLWKCWQYSVKMLFEPPHLTSLFFFLFARICVKTQ